MKKMLTGPYGCANLILSDWPELLQSFQIPHSALIFNLPYVTELVGKGCIFETLLNFLILLKKAQICPNHCFLPKAYNLHVKDRQLLVR